MGVTQMIIVVAFLAFTGWLVAWFALRLLFMEKKFKGRTHSLKFILATNAGKIFQQEFESAAMIDEKLSNPSVFEKLKPEIEKHVDFFLSEKLATVFPLLYKFMGEKTLLQFKAAFMTEIDLLFPVVIKNYMDAVKKDLPVNAIIMEKIQSIPAGSIRRFFEANMEKEMRYFKLACTLIGGLMGGFLLLLLALLGK